jgi:hypothetical protein
MVPFLITLSKRIRPPGTRSSTHLRALAKHRARNWNGRASDEC